MTLSESHFHWFGTQLTRSPRESFCYVCGRSRWATPKFEDRWNCLAGHRIGSCVIYVAAILLLQVTLELLNLSDDMKYSADHFEKAHDHLHMNRDTPVNSNTSRITQQVVKLLDFRSDLPSRVVASMSTWVQEWFQRWSHPFSCQIKKHSLVLLDEARNPTIALLQTHVA